MKKIAKRLLLTLSLLGCFALSGCDPNGSDSSSNIDPDSTSSVSPDSGSSKGSDTSSDKDSPTSSDGSSSSADCLIDSRYPGLDFNTYGAAFREKLSSLITGKTTSYSSCLSIGMKAAAYPNANSSTYIPFYHEAKSSEATPTSGGSNREHCWPKSRGGNLIETDPIVIRPTISADNSARGNDFYGNEKGNEFDPASKTANGSSYEGARGEAARVILYAACRYYSKGLTLSNNPNDDWNSIKSMGTLKTLLKWNMQYQPTAWEKTVNDRYADMGYARNPFVEHPEYANFIWDSNGLRTTKYTVTICGDDGGSSTSSSDGSDSSSSSSSSTDSGTSRTFQKTFNISNWPSGYGEGEQITTDGVTFNVTNSATGYTSGAIQVKKSGTGFFYNETSLGGFNHIALKLIDSSVKEFQSVPVVTYGDAMNPETVATVSQSTDGYYLYDIQSKPYFKIASGDEKASYITEFHLA